MSNASNYLENKLVDHIRRGVAFTAPTVLAYALIVATRGYSNTNRSTAVSLNDTILPATPNGRIYRCTTAGTTGASEPTWPTTNGGTVSDGSAVWTEQTDQLDAGVFTEAANAGNYSRPTLNPSTTGWAATNGAGTTTNPSSGTGGASSNNSAITYGAPSANWGVVFGVYEMDSATYGAGNPLTWAALTTPKTVNNGDPAPSFATGAFVVTIG